MSHAGHDYVTKILKEPLKWLALFWWLGWQLPEEIAGPHIWCHGQRGDVAEKIRHPIG
jgi:hypothetical protein